MAVFIFPSTNNVGAGGKLLSEKNLTRWHSALSSPSFVISGFTVPSTDTDLVLPVAAGEAIIKGYHVVIDTATNVTLTANATNHIYLQLTMDLNGNVTGAQFVANTTGTQPADSVYIATATTNASAVTSTVDKRPLGFVDDTRLGTRTADPSMAPSSNGPAALTTWLSWITNRIKAITGKANWWDSPATTLEAAKAHMDAAAPHSGHETPTGAQAKVDAHANLGQTHGISAPYYIAKTSRADRLPSWNDIPDKPVALPLYQLYGRMVTQMNLTTTYDWEFEPLPFSVTAANGPSNAWSVLEFKAPPGYPGYYLVRLKVLAEVFDQDPAVQVQLAVSTQDGENAPSYHRIALPVTLSGSQGDQWAELDATTLIYLPGGGWTQKVKLGLILTKVTSSSYVTVRVPASGASFRMLHLST